MNQEEALVRAFIVKAKQDRLIELLANPRRRRKVTASLAHFRDLDPRFVSTPAPHAQSPERLTATLRALGAPDYCHVISGNDALDGKRLPLDSILGEIVGAGWGTLLSCIPGQLGYFEGEGPSDRWLLVRHGS